MLVRPDSDNRRGDFGRSTLGGHKLRFAASFQLENVVRKLLVDLNVGVLGETVIAAGLEELLLDRNSPLRIDPQKDARKNVAHPR